MFCDRCGDAISPGEGYDRVPTDSSSGAKPDTILHRRPCEPPEHPTSPADGTGRGNLERLIAYLNGWAGRA